MSILTRTTALVGSAALLAAPGVVLLGPAAHADVERQGVCGGGFHELSVDREGNGWEVDGGVENVEAGSRWRVTLKHDGNRFFRGVLRADHEGDLDVDRYRADSSGNDVFKLRVKRIGTSTSCGATITVS